MALRALQRRRRRRLPVLRATAVQLCATRRGRLVSGPTTLVLTRPDGRRTLRLAATGVPLALDASWYTGARPVTGPATVTPADVLALVAAGWTPSASVEAFLEAVRDGAADDVFSGVA